MDLGALFEAARHAAVAGRVGPAMFGQRAWLMRGVLGVLPVRAVGSDGWEPTEPRLARERALRPIIAVRAGLPEAWGDAIPDCVERHPAGMPTPRGRTMIESWSALRGAEIIDLLACDWALAKPPRRLVGAAATLGFGADGQEDTWEGDVPVQLCRSIGEWVGTLFRARASVLLGNAGEQQATVLRFAGGVVCQDLAHGETVERLMRRQLPAPPRILVQAA